MSTCSRRDRSPELTRRSLFPNPTTSDPPSFSAHLARNLVPEVRIEVQTFYGDLNSAEARYPGLNYSHPPHRLRLGRFPHHRKLFKAFDDLGLTYGEIQDFCCWEGTKWARERYEKDEGITVRVSERQYRRDVGTCLVMALQNGWLTACSGYDRTGNWSLRRQARAESSRTGEEAEHHEEDGHFGDRGGEQPCN